MTKVHEAACQYHEAGLPITLCKVGEKKPYLKGWQAKEYTASEINAEFKKHGSLNVGLVLGPRSQLIDIEYDAKGGERALNELFEHDVPVTPTWLSTRSPHRLFRWHPDLAAVNKASVNLGPLEIRLGANCRGAQSLLPPSRTDNFTRKWQVSIEECDPAPLNVAALQQILAAAKVKKPLLEEEGDKAAVVHSGHREHKRSLVSTVFSVYQSSVHTSPHPPPADFGANPITKAVQKAIAATAPTASGIRHRSIFTFARYLKSIPELADLEHDDLRPYVDWWHQVALQHIGTKAFEETWFDFRESWNAVQYPIGKDPIAAMYAQALSKPLPLCADKYEQRQLQTLVALCRELQNSKGTAPFYLAGRVAAQQIGVDHKTAARWLKMLVMDGVLKLDERGTRHHASEYIYLGD